MPICGNFAKYGECGSCENYGAVGVCSGVCCAEGEEYKDVMTSDECDCNKYILGSE